MPTYSELLRDPRWQKKRLEIMGRDGFQCRLCGDAESTLHVHHLRYDKGADPWDYDGGRLVTVCQTCHDELHSARFGESILEALIVGGASLGNLYDVMLSIEMQVSQGPHAAPLDADQWEAAASGIQYSLYCAARGATALEIRDALLGMLKKKTAA